MIAYKQLQHSWNPLPPQLTDEGARWALIMDSWEGTKYVPGACVKGSGVDCGRWVISCACELRGRSMPALPEIPHDAAFHSPEVAHEARRTILKLMQPVVEIFHDLLQPADIIVVGPQGGGPGHTYYVGPQRHQLWHASPPRVDVTGWAIPAEYTLLHIYRLGELTW